MANEVFDPSWMTPDAQQWAQLGQLIQGQPPSQSGPLAQEYLSAIQKFEGNPNSPRFNVPTWDVRQWSVGYGTRASGPDERPSADELNNRFNSEITNARDSVRRFAPNLDEGTAAALTSLTYNAGPGWQNAGLGRAVQAGNMDEARRLFTQYTSPDPRYRQGLQNRRNQEVQWFGRGAENQPTLGQIAAGNIDLNNRPRVPNPDGSISTVRSMSANFDGREVLLPTISDDGRTLSEQEAIEQYKRTGRHLGIFDTPQNATAYAERLHRDQEQQYANPRRTGMNPLDEYLTSGQAPAPQSGAMPVQTAVDPNAPKGPMGAGQPVPSQAPPSGWAATLQTPEMRAMLISTGLQLMTGGWGNGVQQLGVALGKGAGAMQDTEAARLEQENKTADRGSREGIANAQIAGREQVSAARNETTLLRAAIASGARTNDEHKLWQRDVQQYLTQARSNVSNVGRDDASLMSEANEYARQQMERRRVTGGQEGQQPPAAAPTQGVVTSVPPAQAPPAGDGSIIPQWLRNMFPQPPDLTGRIHPSLGRRQGP